MDHEDRDIVEDSSDIFIGLINLSKMPEAKKLVCEDNGLNCSQWAMEWCKDLAKELLDSEQSRFDLAFATTTARRLLKCMLVEPARYLTNENVFLLDQLITNMMPHCEETAEDDAGVPPDAKPPVVPNPVRPRPLAGIVHGDHSIFDDAMASTYRSGFDNDDAEQFGFTY